MTILLLITFGGALDLLASALDILARALHRVAARGEKSDQYDGYESAQHEFSFR
jgi:hypothetical protein